MLKKIPILYGNSTKSLILFNNLKYYRFIQKWVVIQLAFIADFLLPPKVLIARVYGYFLLTIQQLWFNNLMKSIKNNFSLSDLQKYVKEMVVKRGFQDETIPEIFMLLTEEIGELAKAARKANGMKCDSNSKVKELSHEFADVLNYLAILANKFDINLEQAFKEKERINNNRVWSNKQ